MKSSGLAVLLTLGSLFSFAQAPKTAAAAKPAAKAAAKSTTSPKTLLWEITGNGMEKPSYLFGTMHILCEADANLSENLKNIIRNSDFICFELDMDNMEETMGFMKYARMNDNQKLQDLLSADEYARIEKYFANNKTMLPLSMLTRFKPYFISSLIAERLMDCPKKKSMEELIMAEGKKYNKEIKGIETVAYQAGLFDSIPYKKQAKDLLAYIDSIDNYKKTTVKLAELYKKQDLAQMDTLIIKSDPGMEEFMDILLYNRNVNWTHDIPTISQEGRKTVLFAVGAGHLAGDKGVIALLRKKGYKLKPLPN
jgi:uncharacterized protein YbaP (TraB family)